MFKNKLIFCSMSSATKILTHDVSAIERNSDRIIEKNKYYVLTFEIQNIEDEDLSRYAKKLLIDEYGQDSFPLVCYIDKKTIYLLFSSLENREHNFNGSQQIICSYYASNFALKIEKPVICHIVDFDSKYKVIFYFQVKCYNNTCICIETMSKGKITNQEITNLTQNELTELLKTRSKVDWEKISAKDKFGVFYKYTPPSEEKPKGKITTLSESINPRDINRYMGYFFN